MRCILFFLLYYPGGALGVREPFLGSSCILFAQEGKVKVPGTKFSPLSKITTRIPARIPGAEGRGDGRRGPTSASVSAENLTPPLPLSIGQKVLRGPQDTFPRLEEMQVPGSLFFPSL